MIFGADRGGHPSVPSGWPAETGLVLCLMLSVPIMCEMLKKERFRVEKAMPTQSRPGPPLVTPLVVQVGGMAMWRTCWFPGYMLRALDNLPRVLGKLLVSTIVVGISARSPATPLLLMLCMNCWSILMVRRLRSLMGLCACCIW